jgi:D-alanyl-D-alanine carboxypeptidase
LLTGRLLAPAQLAEMKTTVPATDAQGNVLMHYGLGIYAQDLPCGRFWGHDGAVRGMGTIALSSPDGRARRRCLRRPMWKRTGCNLDKGDAT